MAEKNTTADAWIEVDELVERQLNLQIKIAADRHYQYLVDHGLRSCSRVADIGTGNGAFLKNLAQREPAVEFSGFDKRTHLLERAAIDCPANVDWRTADLLADEAFEPSEFDGLLMRYFFLHIPNSNELLKTWFKRMKAGSQLWIIDVDLSHFQAKPPHPAFQLLINLVQDFCAAHSVDTNAGQNIGDSLRAVGFKNVTSEQSPFASDNVALDDLAEFIRHEALLYHRLLGRNPQDPDLHQILEFVESDVRSGQVDVSYGMINWHARKD